MGVELVNSVNAPNFLDTKFFKDVVENGLFEARVKIKKISFESGCDGGENYCSKIYRVGIEYDRVNSRSESMSVIVKCITVTDSTNFLEDLHVHLKERVFYYHLLPRMEILLDGEKFGASLYHSVTEPIGILAFQDLSPLGYVMADRIKGLDLKHANLVMRRLGQFHAASMILQKKDPECMKWFEDGMLAAKAVNNSKSYEVIGRKYLQSVLWLISKWKGYERIAENIKTYASNLTQNLIRSQLAIPGELKVLNHGDLWVNNVLFKYGKDKTVKDVIFVDFQMSIYGSPGYDLNYFFNTSLPLDVLKEKREELLWTYHAAMCETLKAHNFENIPTFEDILVEVRRRELYGFFACYGILPMTTLDKANAADNSLDRLMDEEFARKKMEILFSSKRVEETMRYSLKRFDELGVLDNL